jgi:phosphoribosylcarboxyaminoimidazole (NCAIR) mutase
MPSGIASALILDPVNAALCAAKLLALKDESLRESIRRFQQQQIDRLIEEDRLIEKSETIEKKSVQERPRT